MFQCDGDYVLAARALKSRKNLEMPGFGGLAVMRSSADDELTKEIEDLYGILRALVNNQL